MNKNHERSLGERIYNTVAHVNHNYIWPSVAHTLGLRILHAWDMGRRAQIKEGQSILELGAGDIPYYRLLGYSSKVGETGRYVTVDIDTSVTRRSQRILDFMDRRDSRRGRSRNFREESIIADVTEQLPFEDASFDRVLMSNLDTSGYADEVFRVLRPGGKVQEAWLEPVVPLFSFIKRNNLKKAGFTHLRLRPGAPTFPIPTPNLPVPVVTMLNWVVTGEKPNSKN